MPRLFPGSVISKTPPTKNSTTASGVWSTQQQIQAIAASQWPLTVVSDPDFEYVSLLLPGNGTNGAQNNTFIDGSTNNFTITRNGNTTQGTFSPYGNNWSNYFDGTGDYLTVPDNAALDFGTSDFTIETWFYANSLANAPFIYDKTSGNGPDVGWFLELTSGVAYFGYGTQNSSQFLTITSSAINTNTWVHIAVTRVGSTLTGYINGTRIVQQAVTNAEIQHDNNEIVRLGSWKFSASYDFSGYLSNYRVVKGSAVYTGTSFTVPSAPLTAIANTSLLTCQSNRFIDNSTNAFAITVNGNTSVQRFSPFSPSAAYSASTIGGSGYFDGTGDYLRIADAAALEVGSGNMTCEAWVYPTAFASGGGVLFGKWDAANAIGRNFTINIESTGALTPYINTTSGITYATTTATLRLNAWNHVAFVKNSTTYTTYINGVSAQSVTQTGSFADVSVPFSVGADGGTTAAFLIGNSYISDVRFLNGTAQYTSGFTPPTAPLTAITNTAVLMNFTNAGIIDNAMMNDLETVGNAQISTTQSKFGGSSMYFDGTGDSANTIASPNLSFGSGNFTVEFWMYTSDAGADVISQRPSGGFGPFGIYIGSSQTIEGYVSTTGSAWVFTGSRSFTNNQWTHVALVRDGSTVYLYVDGTRSTGGNVSTNSLMADTTNPLRIGGTVGNGDFNGYIDDLRITKGIARYTANFTPPTSAFLTM